MIAKEKAKELVGKYEHHSKPMEYGINFSGDIDHAIESALICVDEMLEELGEELKLAYNYWQEVKQEINKL
tara:strand:- start:192 stop:404 length:213 start_codon:yes stop_codon:yes gene_type:complete